MPRRSPTIADGLDEPAHALREAQRPRGPVVIETRGVHKSFRIPEHRVDSFKERAVHPLTRIEHRELHALRDVSFDIHQGEFFGIVGRNGSGKSTLLKIMASIYRADRGRVRMAGRVAPFIELGVGVNPDLTARENAVLNGVMMGLTRREAQRRLGAVIEFAELEEFVDLKLKNYSSGMMVRFAFAVMVQADADIMLIDEVLAVGDAAFAQKCMDVFHERRASGKTIVLVTHDMATVQAMCHRAMLLEEGEVKYIGDPDATALRYYRLNFAGPPRDDAQDERQQMVDFNAKMISATLRDASGEAVENVEQDTPIAIDVVLEAARSLEGPNFGFHVRDDDGQVVFGFTTSLERHVAAGQPIRLRGSIENRLVPGRYYLDCWVRQDESQSVVAVQGLRLLGFVVYGTGARDGVVTVDAEITASLEDAGSHGEGGAR
jgi:ABC-type polysaccharide/polyol phosphate transport system ATPase subunit